MSAHETTTSDLAAAGGAAADDDQVRPEPEAVNVEDDQAQVVQAKSVQAEDDQTPLLPSDQAGQLRTQWQEIQASFVDEPQRAVAEADSLVAEAMQRLASVFSDERERLEAQWSKGDDASTEDLRVALTRYRSFFDRLLST